MGIGDGGGGPAGQDFGTMILNGPPIKTNTFPIISVGSSTSSDWLPFISGSGTATVTLIAPFGLQYVPTSNLQFRVDASAGLSNVGNVSSTVTISPIVIGVTPTLANPFTILNYVPFNYSFSIPDTVIGVTLSSNGTSSALSQYITADGTSFSSDIGFTSALSNAPFSLRPVIGNVSVGNPVTSTVSSALSVITMTPDVPSRSLALYLYEPFSYTFTTNPESIGLSLQFIRSS